MATQALRRLPRCPVRDVAQSGEGDDRMDSCVLRYVLDGLMGA